MSNWKKILFDQIHINSNEDFLIDYSKIVSKSKSFFGNKNFKTKRIRDEIEKSDKNLCCLGDKLLFGSDSIIFLTKTFNGNPFEIFFDENIYLSYQFDFNNSNFNFSLKRHNHFILDLELDKKEFIFFKNLIDLITENQQFTQFEIDSKRNEIIENKRSKLKEKFDENLDGEIDFSSGLKDLSELLKINQIKITSVNEKYVQSFVKIINYLKSKNENIRLFYKRLLVSGTESQLNELEGLIDEEIHTYNLVIVNSLFMLNSLIEEDMISFYEIYEKFDKLNIFNSNWENELSYNLDKVNSNLMNLMIELRNMRIEITNSFDKLTYVTEQSTKQLTSKMEEIDSTLNVSNLINVIQTYQMYKVNKNTKSLRG